MPDEKVSEVPIDGTPTTDDGILTLNSPGGSPEVRTATVANILALYDAITSTLTNKSIDQDGTGNNITNIANASIKAAAAIDATKIADGTVTSAEFQFLGDVTSLIQAQIDLKSPLASPTFTGTVTLPATDLAGNNLDNVQNIIQDISALTGTLINFAEDDSQTVSITTSTTFTGSNYAAGKTKTVKLLDDGSGQTLGFPTGWVFVGTKPTAIAASKTGILTLSCYTGAESGVICAYAEQE